jgi:hypothetical protein
MSAFGTFVFAPHMSAFGGKADMAIGSEKMGYRKLLYPVVLKTFPSLATSSLLNSDCGGLFRLWLYYGNNVFSLFAILTDHVEGTIRIKV